MTVTGRIREVCLKYPDNTALQIKDSKGVFQPFYYKEFYEEISAMGMALKDMGVRKGSHIGIISDNRKEWIITDLAVMGLGAADVPRGSDSSENEIVYILSHSEAEMVFMENFKKASQVTGHLDELPMLKTLVVYNSIADEELEQLGSSGIKVYRYSELIEKGKALVKEDPEGFDREVAKGTPDDLATIIYTSGTTGTPKGVMLTHKSFLFQIDRIRKNYITVNQGQTLLSMLPIWHAFERAVEYIVFCYAANVAYSQPVGAILHNDIQKTRAEWMTSVPRIWDGIRSAVIRAMNKSGKFKRIMFHTFLEIGILYRETLSYVLGTVPRFYKRNRIMDMILGIVPLIILFPLNLLGHLLVFRKFKKILGGRFIAGISGGGSLAGATRRFFRAIGIKVLEGYGLTETGPVLSVCKQKAPVYGTVGPILPDVEYKVVNSKGKPVPVGSRGILWVKSPQVMLGYYKRDDETAKVMEDGWLNTGDIVIATLDNEVKIVGRAKETIVLRGGENIEPVPIEDACLQSPYVDQIVVLGQDQKFIAALVVPDYKYLEEKSKEKGIAYMDMEDLVSNPQVHSMVYSAVSEIVSKKNGFKDYEKIFRIHLLAKPFKVGDELTNTLKVKRNVVSKKYKSEIAKLFK